MDCALANSIASEACTDVSGMVAAACDALSLGDAIRGERGDEAAKLRAKLLADCKLATGSDAAAQALAEIHEAKLRIDAAKTCAEKIGIAMDRRAILRRLVAATVKAGPASRTR